MSETTHDRLARLNELAKKRTQGELEATPFGIRLKEYPHLTVASHFTGRSPMDDCRYFAAMPEALSIANELQARLDAALDSTQPTASEQRERELRDLAAALEGEIIDAHAYANDPAATSWNHMIAYLSSSMKLAARIREKLSTTQPRGDL